MALTWQSSVPHSWRTEQGVRTQQGGTEWLCFAGWSPLFCVCDWGGHLQFRRVATWEQDREDVAGKMDSIRKLQYCSRSQGSSTSRRKGKKGKEELQGQIKLNVAAQRRGHKRRWDKGEWSLSHWRSEGENEHKGRFEEDIVKMEIQGYTFAPLQGVAGKASC